MATLGSETEFDKLCIRYALKCQLYAGDNGTGPVFKSASPDECIRFILEVFDKWYSLAKDLSDSSRAIESIMQRHGWSYSFDEYIRAKALAEREYNTYLFEYQKDSLHDEVSKLERHSAIDASHT